MLTVHSHNCTCLSKDYLKQKEVIGKKTNKQMSKHLSAMQWLIWGSKGNIHLQSAQQNPSARSDKQRAQGQGIHVWTSAK